ncbi:MAG: type II toxin-antitoxin system PemK/MazF family toxin [Opitutales bacterium]|nr:type II toxin-antitoxin system PemK/MazF family toxin [Opitutales bacterium]
MRRGDVVTVSAPGDFGKPRPAVIIQSDALTDSGIGSVLLCLLTSKLVDAPLFRISIEPDTDNGLDRPSQIMADKILAVSRTKIGGVIGRLRDEQIVQLNRTLAFVTGLGSVRQ